MQALSLWQPWASLMAFGTKKVETRHWPFRGPKPVLLAIHAAQKWDRVLYDLCRTEPFARVLREHRVRFVERPKASASTGPGQPSSVPRPELPFGAIVAIGRLQCCPTTEEFGSDPRYAVLRTEQEIAFGNYSLGRFAWVFDAVRPLKAPVPERGHQSLWNWQPNAEAAAIAAELGGGRHAARQA
jgi:hypothetical protein